MDISKQAKQHKIASSFVFALAVFYGPAVNAESTLGIKFGASYWTANIQNQLQSDNFTDADGDVIASRFSAHEIGIGDTSQTSYFVEFRHNIPFLPRVRYENAPLSEEGKTTLTRDLNFVDTIIPAATALDSTIDLSYQDISLYYSLAEGGLDLDIGVTQREIEGEVALTFVPVDDGDGGDEGDGGDGGDTGEDTEGTTANTSTVTGILEDSPILVFTRLSFPLFESDWRFSYTFQYNNTENEYYSDTESLLSYGTKDHGYDYSFDIGYKKAKFMADDMGGLASKIKVSGPFLRFTVGL
ncbi:MAG: hypothetical protein K6L81_00435 [Agarilytica sp.]